MSVAIYGATGWTGALVAQSLERRGVPLVLVGRDAAKLAAARAELQSSPETRVASIEDAASLSAALKGVDIVVNCAGPYDELGDPIIEAALRTRCHYFDASGEHSFLRRVYEQFDEQARRAEVTICAGFAAKGALGDWGASVLARELGSPVDEVAIAYAHGLREYFRPSAGSVLSAAGQHFLKPIDQYDPNRPIARRFFFPPPFGAGYAVLVPGAEDVSVPRHLEKAAVRSYLSMAPGSPVNEPWARACVATLPWVPLFSETLKKSRAALEKVLRKPREGRDQDTFVVAVEVRRGDSVIQMGLSTRDAYAVTAEIIAHGVSHALSRRTPGGVIAPALFCDPRAALASLSRSGAIRVRRFVGVRAA